MVQFEKIIIGDFFKDRLSAYSIINIGLCSKNLYNSLEREYNNAMDDLTIYTWSRNWAMDVFIWGKAWNQELTKWIPGQVRYLDSGSTWIQLDELRCQDDDFFEFIQEIYGSNPKHKHITGKVSKERELCQCPTKKLEFYI